MSASKLSHLTITTSAAIIELFRRRGTNTELVTTDEDGLAIYVGKFPDKYALISVDYAGSVGAISVGTGRSTEASREIQAAAVNGPALEHLVDWAVSSLGVGQKIQHASAEAIEAYAQKRLDDLTMRVSHACSPEAMEVDALATIRMVEFAYQPDAVRRSPGLTDDAWEAFLSSRITRPSNEPLWRTLGNRSIATDAATRTLIHEIWDFWHSRVLFWSIHCRPTQPINEHEQ